MRRRRPTRSAALAIVGGAAVLLAILLAATPSGERAELQTVDLRFSLRGPQAPPPDVAFVAIDADTLTETGAIRFGEWPRTHHADVIRRLHRAGARVIAYDVQFTERSGDDDADLALYDAAAAAGRIVLATTETGAGGATAILGGDENLRAGGITAGQGLLPNDIDGVIRRLPYEVGGLRSFAVAAAGLARGRAIRADELPAREPWIDYAGPPGSIPTYPFRAVRAGEVPAAAFRGKVVVVGPTAPTLQDLHPTSTSGADQMSGGEIQANAIATVLRGADLRSAPGWLGVLATLLLGLAVPAASVRLSQFRTLLLALFLGVAYLGVGVLAFGMGSIVSLAEPELALALSSVGTLVVTYVAEARARERLRTQFGRFVPEAVVDQVVRRTDGDLRLGGVRLESTVLFSDLRGFTSFAEQLEPPEVIDVLNAYLTEMSDAILDHGGTLVAYMGDGIMAVFGAPLEQDDHADRAWAAAREMLLERLPRFNAWLAADGRPPFRMGIGLNSGPIMSGNVGSARRLEYTAVGDTTNTAARLEAMTKGTRFQLLLSEATRERLRTPSADLEPMGEVPVRGRAGALRVWGLPDA